MNIRSHSGLVTSLRVTLLAATPLLASLIGCGGTSNPQESCKLISQVSLPGDPQTAALFGAAAYKDCLLGYETDSQKAGTLKSQGQLEALKGFLLIGVQSANTNTDSLKSRILAASDLNTALGFLSVLKLTGRFSDADITKLDGMYPHLGLADAIHTYEQRGSPH